MRGTLALLVLLLPLYAACGRPASATAERSPVRPTYDSATGRLSALALDADGDARFEATAHMEGRTLRRVDVDENGDGVPERREHYTSVSQGHPAAPEPELATVEQLDPSGTVRRREGYDAGQLTWAEEDRDGDGTMDRRETWSMGALTSVTIVRPGAPPPLRIVYPDASAATTAN